MTRSGWIIVVLAAVLFFGAGWALLQNGHPHEDAYILFKYVRMWASGEGIVYYAGGPHTEGATDFGWLALLTGLHRLGLDTAIAALACNALGAALTASALLSLVRWNDRPATERVVFGALILLVPLLPAAHAGYVGFSTMLYSGVTLTLYALYVHPTPGRRLYLPAVALALALMRPDGAILGLVFTALGFRQARFDGILKHYVRAAVLPLIAGALYFLWRMSYFGEVLPLPLIVKSHSSALLPGLEPNLKWLAGRAPRIGVLAVLAFLARDSMGARRRLLCGLAPGALLFLALLFAMQSQNVGNRFQAPVVICIHGALLALAALPSRLPRKRLMALVALACVLISARDARTLWRYTLQPAVQTEYIDGYAHTLPQCISEGDHIALTEAGRVGYWSSSTLSDLVGLNDARYAHSPATAERIDEFGLPDILMLHHAGALITGDLPDMEVVHIADLEPRIRPWAQSANGHTSSSADPVARAAAAGLIFLKKHADKYEVYAVRYRGGLNHVWAIRSDHPALACIVRTLNASFAESPSYADLAF